jgi:hypothetical protein
VICVATGPQTAEELADADAVAEAAAELLPLIEALT